MNNSKQIPDISGVQTIIHGDIYINEKNNWMLIKNWAENIYDRHYGIMKISERINAHNTSILIDLKEKKAISMPDNIEEYSWIKII